MSEAVTIDTEFLRSQVDQTRDIGMEFAADLAEDYIPWLCDELDATRAELAEAKKQLADVHGTLMSVMTQACWHEDGYDTMCLSAYEGAAEYLVKAGRFVDCNETDEDGWKVMRYYKDVPREAKECLTR